MQMILKPYVYREYISSTTESLEKASYLNFSVTIICRLMKTRVIYYYQPARMCLKILVQDKYKIVVPKKY